MKYDVFLISALADSDKADLIVRRLRALKFKVRYDKKRAHTTPTPKDIRDANDSQSVITLWSKAACDTTQSDSDWVHAMAHQARSRPGVLLQAGLDKSVPDEPFDKDDRYKLAGLTAKTTVKPFYDLADELGRRDGRKDLSAWMKLKPRDKDGKEAWKASHPADPLALVAKPKTKPKPKAAAAKPKAKPIIDDTADVVIAATAAPAASVASKPIATRRKAPPLEITPPTFDHTDENDVGLLMLAAIGAGILAMLLFSLFNSSKPGGAAIGNACVTASAPVLETGFIIDDTSEIDPARLRANLTGKFTKLGYDWLDVSLRGPIATLRGTAPNLSDKLAAFEAGRATILTDPDAANTVTLVVDDIAVTGGQRGVAAALSGISEDASLISCQTAFTNTMAGRNIEFEIGSAAINPVSARLLDALTAAAILCDRHDMEIAGHSDTTGDQNLNLILSQQRAESVKSYLTTRAVDGANITATGYGASRPLVDGDTPEAHARNRRTEFMLSSR